MNVDLSNLRTRAPLPLLTLAESAGRMVKVRTGTAVFRAGDPVAGLHLVVEGGIRVTRAGAGRAVTVHTEGVGGMLGEIALFSDGTYPATAVAIEPSILCFVPAAAVRRALGVDTALAELLLHRMADRARGVISRLDRLVHLTVLQRLALHLLDRHASSRAPVMTLGMTQSALAEELGTVKEIVVRALRTLRELDVIEPVGGGRYRVLDAARLRALADQGKPYNP